MSNAFDEYTDAMNTVQERISLLCGKNEKINFGGYSVGKIKDFSDEIVSGNFKLILPAGKDMSISDIYDSNISRFLEQKHQLFITDLNKKSPENVVASLIEYASTQRVIVPEKTQERWKELINSGENVENIKNYIDHYSKSKGLQEDFLQPLKKESVIGKELADFMVQLNNEYHSGGHFEVRNDQKSSPSFEDVLERSREHGLTLPKNHIEIIRTSIEEQKSSVKEHLEQIEKMGARHNEKGFNWHVREDHNPKYPLLYYIDKHHKINAYVMERTNSQTDERFYVANRINENGEHFKVTSNNNLDVVKNHVAAYYTGATIREFSLEMSTSIEKSQQFSPNKSKELELSL